MNESQRNLLILVLVAIVGVVFSGAFSVGAGSLMLLLRIAFAVAMIWFLITLYQRNSGTIALMPATPRLVLQAASIALLAVVVTGLTGASFLPSPFGWANWGGSYTLLFWASCGVCGFGIWWAWQQRTTKW